MVIILGIKTCEWKSNEFLVHNWYKYIKKIEFFTLESVEASYWEQLYASDGTSGAGSIGAIREWKWDIIEKYAPILDSVLDVGCGDLSFWEGKDCYDYVGIDVSRTIIEMNRIKRPHWIFIRCNAETKIPWMKKKVVFCFDVLFHILKETTFKRILTNIFDYS